MPDIQTRLNAVIAYLFLAPIILLARSGTPLAEPYVQSHARRASVIIIIGILALTGYGFLRGSLAYNFFGISLSDTILIVIMSTLILTLLHGAYRAYSGIEAGQTSWRDLSVSSDMSTTGGAYSEEQKIRIVASFLPFVGIIIADRMPSHETDTGRRIGMLMTTLILLSIGLLSGSVNTVTLILTLITIGLIVATGVYLFGFSQFLQFGWYRYIPTYLELETRVTALILTAIDMVRIAFGGSQTESYQTRYDRLMRERTMRSSEEVVPYFLPRWIIGLPIINLITLPSLWQSRYRSYRHLILQGLMLTILSVFIVSKYGIGADIGLGLLYPIITIMSRAGSDIRLRAPITSIICDIASIIEHIHARIQHIQKQASTVSIEYPSEGGRDRR